MSPSLQPYCLCKATDDVVLVEPISVKIEAPLQLGDSVLISDGPRIAFPGLYIRKNGEHRSIISTGKKRYSIVNSRISRA